MAFLTHAVRPLCILVALMALAACSSTASGLAVPSAGAEVTPLQPTVGAAAGDLVTVKELPPPPETQGGAEQPIAASDIIEVSVFQVPDLSRTVQVDEGGRVSLPLIGVVPAAGKTVRTLENDIRTAYAATYLQSPEVSVFVKESAGKRVTVDGEVNKAGVFPLPPTASLLDAIALAGGFKPVANPDQVYVFRQIGDKKLVAKYDVSAIRRGQRPSPRVYGGDVVVVFASGSRVAIQNLKEALGIARLAVF